MRIARRFTIAGRSPYDGTEFRVAARDDEVDAPGIEVPVAWSAESCEALAELCFTVPCVPRATVAVPEADVPGWLWRRRPERSAAEPLDPEHDARQVFDRIAGAWTYQGWKGGAFDSEEDAAAFHDEICHLLCQRMISPEPAAWRATGLRWAYGVGGARGGWIVDDRSGELRRAEARDLPPHGAAIVRTPRGGAAVDGVLAPWREESLVLAEGLDTAIDVSALAGEGKLIAALGIGDAVARAIGEGASRARTIVLDAAHPDAPQFAARRMRAAGREAMTATGAHIARRHLAALAAACHGRGRKAFDPARNPSLRLALIAAREAGVPEDWVERALRLAHQGRALPELPALDETVAEEESGIAAERQVLRISGEVEGPAVDHLALAAWMGPGSGALFADTADAWNPCPADGRIAAMAADGGYVFLDGTACPRAAVNLLAFRHPDGSFDAPALADAVRLLVVALDSSLAITAQPTPGLADGVWRTRPIGISIANLAPLLLAHAEGYNSAGGRALAAAVAALVGGAANCASAEMAGELGAFPRFADNREAVLRVIANHARAAAGARDGYEALPCPPVALDAADCPDPALAEAARLAWQRAATLAAAHGVRHAQTTLVAPLGASERILGCAACGIDPLPATITYERLPGAGFRKGVSREALAALASLGYDETQVAGFVAHAVGRNTLVGAPAIDHRALRERGFTEAALQALEGALANALDIRFVFNRWTLGAEFCTRVLGFSLAELDDYGFDMLAGLGFSESEIAAANAWCCGASCFEGAPGLDAEHLGVFDGPRRQGGGKRALTTMAQLRMMAAVQPYVSGGVGRALALPAEATIEDCAAAVGAARQLGLKGLMVAREGAAIAVPADVPQLIVRRLHEPSTPPDRRFGPPGRSAAAPPSLRERLTVIEGGEHPSSAPQPTAQAGGTAMAIARGTAGWNALAPNVLGRSQALAIALTARDMAAAANEEHHETCRTDRADARCQDCGSFALLRTEAGAKCGICGAVHRCSE